MISVRADRHSACETVALRAAGRNACPTQDERLAIDHKHIAIGVGVSRDQIGGIRHISHVAAVGAHDGNNTVVVCLEPACGDTNPLGESCNAITNKNIGLGVGVELNDVVRVRFESNKAAVATDRWVETRTITLAAVERRRHARRRAQLPIV
jgi:hypothetical protein